MRMLIQTLDYLRHDEGGSYTAEAEAEAEWLDIDDLDGGRGLGASIVIINILKHMESQSILHLEYNSIG
jgi:hypothetical protein